MEIPAFRVIDLLAGNGLPTVLDEHGRADDDGGQDEHEGQQVTGQESLDGREETGFRTAEKTRVRGGRSVRSGRCDDDERGQEREHVTDAVANLRPGRALVLLGDDERGNGGGVHLVLLLLWGVFPAHRLIADKALCAAAIVQPDKSPAMKAVTM